MGTDSAGTIVVGVDGSPHSLAALRWAIAEAHVHGAAVRAVDAWHVPTVAYELPFRLEELSSEARGEAEAALGAALAALADAVGNVVVEQAVREGDPGHVLVAESEGALQLVVGSRGHGNVGELILGSVSHYCCRHARCPVTVIPHAIELPAA